MSEQDRMAAGDWYSCLDDGLEALRQRARRPREPRGGGDVRKEGGPLGLKAAQTFGRFIGY